MKNTHYLLLFKLLLCTHVAYSQFGPDVVIQPDTNDQRRVEIATAFNGWMFAAYARVDAANNKGGLTISKSTDGGYTWTEMDAYFPEGVRYVSHDLVVTGSTEADLVVTLAGVNHQLASNIYTIFVDRYNGNTGNFLGSAYNLDKGNLRVYDVELATDFGYSSVGASPFSISLLYSSYTPTLDSLVSITSLDGGLTYTNRQVVATTGQYFRNISLDYGRSTSASNGRYFAAWERMASMTARTGNIYTSRNVSQVNGSWSTPENLDSLSSTMIGMCRNPRIAVSKTMADNDSLSLTAVILVDRDYMGSGTDFDLLGFHNSRAHFSDFWYRMDVLNASNNDMTPDIVFDTLNKLFHGVFYDSTNYNLRYVTNDWNLTDPNNWGLVNTGMNDDSLSTALPFPRITWRPNDEVGIAWVDESPEGKGIVKFDLESFMFASTEDASKELQAIVYPNPVKHVLNIELDGAATTSTVSVMDLNGRLVRSEQLNGQTVLSLDVHNLSSGTYLLRLANANGFASAMFVKE